MLDPRSRRLSGLALAMALVHAWSAPAPGGVGPPLIYTGGTGDIAFGVTPYGGAPNVGAPTYIANNFTGRDDILASPGLGTLGGYLTANPVVANNIATYGPNLPIFATQSGGGNAFGTFGQGAAINLGSQVGYSLTDSGPGGGSASYEIMSSNITYRVGSLIPAGTSYGAFVTMGGSVPLVGNADVDSLRVHVSDTAGVFGAGGIDLPQMVLAISRNGSGSGIGNYNIVAIGGTGGGNAALVVDNGVTGAFRALAIDNIPLPGALPVNDILSVSYTLTAYADPANFGSFDPTLYPDLLALTGPLPTASLIGTAAAFPEPASIALVGMGLIGTLGHSLRGRRRRKGAE